MHWDGSISFGNIVTIAAFVVTLYGFHVKNIERFTRLEIKVGLMWSQLRRKLDMGSDGEDEYNN